MRSFSVLRSILLVSALSGCQRDTAPTEVPTEPDAPAPAPTAAPVAEVESPGSDDAEPAVAAEPTCTLETLEAAVSGAEPWTDEGPRCAEVFGEQCLAGDGRACTAAAIIHLQAVGGAKPDPDGVEALLRKACDKKTASACRDLGVLVAGGDVGSGDKDEGLALIGRACKLGDADACEMVPAKPKLVNVPGANVNTGSLSADGLELRELTCSLDRPLLGAMAVAGALSKRKKALDRCAPAGQAFVVHWSFKGGKTRDVTVSGGTPKQQQCVSKAMSSTPAVMPAKCGAILLVGKRAKAEASIAGLGT